MNDLESASVFFVETRTETRVSGSVYEKCLWMLGVVMLGVVIDKE